MRSTPATALGVDVLYEVAAGDFGVAGVAVSFGSEVLGRRPNASSSVLINALHVGEGVYEARIAPAGGWTSDVVAFSVLFETKDGSGRKEVPRRYQAFHGASMVLTALHRSATCRGLKMSSLTRSARMSKP